MKYKLFNEVNKSPLTQILINREISAERLEEWINAGWPQINSPWLFGKEKVKHAIKLMSNCIFDDTDFYVLVDCDADGFTSAALIMNYLYKVYPERIDCFHYILHTGKQHGLEDTVDQIPDNCLVILPDSSTNDIEQMRELLDRGCTIICMDHHEADNYLEDEDNLVIINNQICDYPNKDLSAAGVVWQICRAWDEINETNYANDFIDLAALGLISDMMDYRSIETKAIISLGLQDLNKVYDKDDKFLDQHFENWREMKDYIGICANPFFCYMCKKNKFSIKKMDGVNYMSVAFYVTPFINAIVRSGTMEEKDLIFKSMLSKYAFEKIESGKRGHKGELVPRVEEAVRICTNVKARQTKLQDTTMVLLEKRIRDNNLLDNAIILLQCEPGEVEKNLAGLVANKIQAKYQRPTLVLIKGKTVGDKEFYYRGSARNYSMSENQDLRQTCLDTGLTEYSQGHSNAFGTSIAESDINDFILKTNEIYENIPQEPVYWVDFIWTKNEIDGSTILKIAESKDFWGQGIPEPYICVENLNLSTCQAQLMGVEKGHPTLKIQLDNGVSIIRFKASEEEYEKWIEPNKILTGICKCSKNEWMGNISPQLILEDYNLETKWIF